MSRRTRQTSTALVALLLVLAAVMIRSGPVFAGANGKGAGVAGEIPLLDEDGEKAARPGQYSGHAPGLIVTITGVKIPKDRRPVVSFTATDERGDPVGKNELTESRFILAYLVNPGNGSTPRYVSYNTRIEDPDTTVSGDEAIQATYDLANLTGLKQKSDGTFKYKFATALPVDYDRAASHQIGGQFRRLFGADGVVYRTNAVLAFRPDGNPDVDTREVVNTETCNNCHTRLSLHGDIRREIQLCILCHTPQTTDAQSGNNLDMAVMTHKIHMGEMLPSVEDGEPYQIVGFGGVVHDYSDVAFPQDIRNCEVCHEGVNPDYHLNNPTMNGCASCHDRTWFNIDEPTPEGYTEHLIGVPLTDDSLCKTCHTPTEPGVKPIWEAHLRPQETEDAPGLHLEITSTEILNADTTPQLRITFTIEKGDGTPVADLNTNTQLSVNGTIAYPVSDYSTYNRNIFKGNGASGTLVNNGDGSYTYTFNDPNDTLPLGSTDTFAVALEGRWTFTHDGVNYQQGTDSNARTIFTLDGSTPVERRTSVLEESCNACHGEIRAHGQQRIGVDYCLMCHHVKTTDEVRRDPVNPNSDPETVNFKDMLHRIHRGEELESDYTVYGFGNVAHDFTHILFPGDLRQCTICHDTDAYNLPTAPEAQPTMITENGGQPVQTILPQTAACTSCHDSLAAQLHAVINSDVIGGAESCEVCHGTEAEFAVESVHDLGP